MDSSNERHVFECITHACATGGKQVRRRGSKARTASGPLLPAPCLLPAGTTPRLPVCHASLDRALSPQYFLISPKLLPDLEYGEATNISFVLNGVHNLPREAFSFANYA